MLKKTLWMGLVMAVMFLPSVMLGQEMMHGKWWHNKAIAEELQLTGREVKQLDDKYTQSRRRLIDLKSDVERERFELDTLLDAGDFNKKQVMKRYEHLEKARTKLSKERFDMLMDVREIIGSQRFQMLKTMHRDRNRDKIKKHFKDDSTFRNKARD